MRHAQLLATGSFVPDRVITNAEMDTILGEPVSQWVIDNVGIRERHVMADDQTTSDLVVEAAKKALARAGLAATDLDLIILSTGTPDYLSPSTSVVVQHKLGAANAAAYDVNSACAGWVTALDQGARYLATEPDFKYVLVAGGYGLTEVGTNCFSMTNEDALAKTGSVGKPIFHSRMWLIDPETGEAVAVSQAGELLISGPHVCAGYWRNPQATAEAIREGWFHTGDMARVNEAGFFYIVGRYKDMLKSGSENIYAAEVEMVFRNHPAVADAALIGQPDPQWGEVGLMVLKPDQAITDLDLLIFCEGKLAKYKIPKRIVLAEALPYSPYGKVEKAKLRAKYL